MAFRLVGVKPLSEPMLEYCKLDPWERNSIKFNQNSCIFIQGNAFENVVWKMTAILSRPQCVNIHITGKWQSLDGPSIKKAALEDMGQWST